MNLKKKLKGNISNLTSSKPECKICFNQMSYVIYCRQCSYEICLDCFKKLNSGFFCCPQCGYTPHTMTKEDIVKNQWMKFLSLWREYESGVFSWIRIFFTPHLHKKILPFNQMAKSPPFYSLASFLNHFALVPTHSDLLSILTILRLCLPTLSSYLDFTTFFDTFLIRTTLPYSKNIVNLLFCARSPISYTTLDSDV